MATRLSASSPRSWERTHRWPVGGLVVTLVAALLVVVPGPVAASAAPVCADERPDARSAALLAKACDRRVEVVAGRSEYTQVFANPDGTSTFESTVVPARVRRDGGWVPADTTLRVRPDGSIGPVASVADVVFSSGGPGPFVTYREGGSLLTLGWPGTLPAPTLAANTAIYAEVSPGVDLRVTATATGFRHVVVVKSAAAAKALARLRLPVGGDAAARPTGDGRVVFADASGRTIALTSAASMWDSTVDPAAAGEVRPGVDTAALRAAPPAAMRSSEKGPGPSARSARLGVAVEGRGVVLTPDTSWLNGATFPVFIDPQIGPPRSKWAYANSINSNWDVTGQAWIGANPYDGTLYRSFFDFPTTYNGQTYKGKQIIAASFSIMLDHSWSCTATIARLYRTSAITVSDGARMSWSTRPLGSGAVYLDWAEAYANEAGGCGYTQDDMLMTFGGNTTMRDDVQTAATANANTYTVGLCACDTNGANEATQSRWKRFHIDGNLTMSVTYNTVPGTPAYLSPYQGQVACGGVVGTYSPVLQAQYVDADGSDTLSATFAWRQGTTGTVTNVAGPSKPANNNGTVTLSLGSGAEDLLYQFQVRTHDGNAYSPWSPWCSFTVDTSAPPAPTVTAVTSGSAPVYASCDPGDIDNCVERGGPGVAGAFQFSVAAPAGQNVVKYRYGWSSPTTDVTVAAGATSAAILLTPPRYGLNTLLVQSVDTFSRVSATTSYWFLVQAPSAALAHWPLDSVNGHNFTDQVSGNSLTTTGASWTANARYIGANSATFSTTGEGTQTVSAFDTSGSFSVSAWARLSTATCPGGNNRTAVAIDGHSTASSSNVSGFFLGYHCQTQKWRFRLPDKNIGSPAIAEAGFVMPTPASQWTFLVGVWDENEKKIRLYVNGVLAEEVTPSSTWLTSRGSGWKATGAVTIGRDRFNLNNGGRFDGEVADVRLWNRVVTVDDISGTNEDLAHGVPATNGLDSPLSVGDWKFYGGECFCTTVADDSSFVRDLFVMPNWSIDPNWANDPLTAAAWLTQDSHDGDGAIQLNGTSGYATSTDDAGTVATGDDVTHTVLRTDQSFTVSAWVRVTDTTTEHTVLHQRSPGSHSAMKLYLSGVDGTWRFAVTTAADVWTKAISAEPAVAGDWVHLVGVFNKPTNEVRLYVNGEFSDATTGTAATGWLSTGSLTVGGTAVDNTYFAGTIDRVGTWQGVLNAREIRNLYETT